MSENRQLVNNWSYTFLLQRFLSIKEMAVTNNNNREKLFLKIGIHKKVPSYLLHTFLILPPEFTRKPLPKILHVRLCTYFVPTQDFTREQALANKNHVRMSTGLSFFHSFVYNSVERILSLFYKSGIISYISER